MLEEQDQYIKERRFKKEGKSKFAYGPGDLDHKYLFGELGIKARPIDIQHANALIKAREFKRCLYCKAVIGKKYHARNFCGKDCVRDYNLKIKREYEERSKIRLAKILSTEVE